MAHEKPITLYHASLPKNAAFAAERALHVHNDPADAFRIIEATLAEPAALAARSTEFKDAVMKTCAPSPWTGPKQFTYVRYDPDVSAKGLAALGLTDIKPEPVQAMDAVANIKDIQRVGAIHARQVLPGHLGSFVPTALSG